MHPCRQPLWVRERGCASAARTTWATDLTLNLGPLHRPDGQALRGRPAARAPRPARPRPRPARPRCAAGRARGRPRGAASAPERRRRRSAPRACLRAGARVRSAPTAPPLFPLRRAPQAGTCRERVCTGNYIYTHAWGLIVRMQGWAWAATCLAVVGADAAVVPAPHRRPEDAHLQARSSTYVYVA